MKLKKTIKFSLNGYKKPLLIYYGILCACIIAGIIITALNKSQIGSIGGLEMTTVVFLFITGLSSFRADLYLYLQNGISRKTACLTYFITSMVVTAFMAFIESVCYTMIGRVTKYDTAFHQIYQGFAKDNMVVLVLVSFAWSFFLYFAATMLGYLISALYYRMNKTLRLIVSIGVPISILVLLPAIDFNIAKGAISRFFNKVALWMMGVNTNTYHPENWMMSCAVMALIFGGLSYLLIKKAMVKSM